MSDATARAFISGVGLTAFGRQPGRSALEWQAAASMSAIADANLDIDQIDGVLCGYATTLGHLMPANLLAEYIGVRPRVAAGLSVGGATGLAMLAQAAALVESGRAHHVLVAAGEDRASGQSADSSIAALAQVGHRGYEVPIGANIPAYYALLASAYLDRFGLDATTAFTPLAVLMREHACRHEGAQFRDLIAAHDVASSRLIADPLRLLDCCPISDGGAAFVVSCVPGERRVSIDGIGQAHRHQHVSMADFDDFGARRSAIDALGEARVGVDEIDVAGIYDSFTITLALLLEEIGFAGAGESGRLAASGEFSSDGRLPLNTHGGLLSYGHCGVGGGIAHLVEVVTQLRGEAGPRQVARRARRGFVHADGGVLSAHVSVVLGGVGLSR